MRKVFCLILSLSVLFTFPANAIAPVTSLEPNYIEMTNAEIANLTGLTEVDVEDARELFGDDFNTVMDQYATSDLQTASFGPMGDYCWDLLSDTFANGVIVVSKDQTTVLRHGHAAICYTSSYVIEHPGLNDISTMTSVSDAFEHLGAVATFIPTGSTLQERARAANYAYNNLQGWEYLLYAPRNSLASTNCSNLVWKAYNYVGIETCDPGDGYTTPSMFDTDGYNTLLYATDQYVGAAWIFSDNGAVTE